MANVTDAIFEKNEKVTEALEREIGADVLGLFGPIAPGVEHRVRQAIEKLPTKLTKLAIVVNTLGGSIETTERIVSVVRHNYAEIVFIVPNLALSAGTVLAMSGDAILMNYFSCLGPIDPQVQREGRWVPALSYLDQFRALTSKGTLSEAELTLLNKLDLAELQAFEQAKLLTEELLVKWLANYKFKNWTKTTSKGLTVDQAMREKRAREIAQQLNDNQRWKSHGRGIPMEVLRKELNLVIEDFSGTPSLDKAIKDYSDFIGSLMAKEQLISFVTSRSFI